MYTRHPNILRWVTFGFSPKRASLRFFFLLLDEEYDFVHTQISLMLLPISASKDFGHVALLSMPPLLFYSFVLQFHYEDCIECSTPS